MVPDGELVIKVADLVVGDRLRVPDLAVHAGDRVLVTGRNGAGKTTLLRALAVHLGRGGGTGPGASCCRRRTTACGCPRPVLEFFRSQVPMYADEAEATLAGYLFDAGQQAQPLGTLSAGELRRLLLAAMVNSGAQILLLDEPTNYLDFDALDVVEQALREFRGTLVMVTHDRYFAASVGYTHRWSVSGRHGARRRAGQLIAMSTKRDRCSWAATVTVSVGPFRCLATMKSASPARGDSLS